MYDFVRRTRQKKNKRKHSCAFLVEQIKVEDLTQFWLSIWRGEKRAVAASADLLQLVQVWLRLVCCSFTPAARLGLGFDLYFFFFLLLLLVIPAAR